MSTPEFDLLKTALEPGITLIEAGAGTGKTFALAVIYLRLILERDVHPNRILAVTYTQAATEELRTRVRQFLLFTRAALRGAPVPNPVIEALVATATGERTRQLRAVEQALEGFDQIHVHTIHGFCNFVLTQFPFETGRALHFELVPDTTQYLYRLASDFWRRELLGANPLAVSIALKQGLDPERLTAFWARVLTYRAPRILPDHDAEEWKRVLAATAAAAERILTLWAEHGHTIKNWFLANIDAFTRPYNDPDFLRAAFNALDNSLGRGVTCPEALDVLAQLAPAAFTQKKRKRYSGTLELPPELTELETLLRIEPEFVAALYRHSVRFLQEHLPKLKRDAGVIFYDDLLDRLHRALTGSHAHALVHALRDRFDATLIDEFQDTDPLQYEIFDAIFGGPHTDKYMVLIGDPKQAIYGFRGADVFAYLRAAARAQRRFTLPVNRRSDPALITALNTVFGSHPAPFIIPGIEYIPAKTPVDARSGILRVCEQPAAGLELWFYPASEKPLAVSRIEQRIAADVAAEIARLITAGATLGTASVAPSNFAVLVRENRQADTVQQELAKVRIPSVLYSTGSVFESHEATELWRVLNAVADPTNEELIKAALLTDMLGWTLDRLDAAIADENEWVRVLAAFAAWRRLWETRGFLVMFAAMAHSENIKANLMRFANGHRKITNLWHMAELIHQAELTTGPDPEMTLHWLATRMQARAVPAEEHQLRLETDEHAVKLVTVHRSKGLEFDIVFCPYTWRGVVRSNTRADKHEEHAVPVAFCHEPDSATPLLDINSDKVQDHLQTQLAETLAEDVRTLYVALTRARHKCYLAWGMINGAETSAASWLLLPPAHAPERWDQALGAAIGAKTGTARTADAWTVPWYPGMCDPHGIKTALERLASASTGTITVTVRGRPAPTPELVPSTEPATAQPGFNRPPAPPEVLPPWTISSYSRMVTGLDVDQPDYEPGTEPVAAAPPEASTSGLPKGILAGTCLHRIMEQIDFNAPDSPANRRIIAAELAACGLAGTTLVEHVHELVRRALCTPLIPNLGLTMRGENDLPATMPPAFMLKDVPPEKRVTELEFCFPVRRLEIPALARTLAEFGIESARELLRGHEHVITGFMKGFIDLVFEVGGRFFILDWKTNWLGDQPTDYAPGKLSGEILARHYYLQYLTYTLALDRFLAWRVPNYDYNSHFGGVWYVFVRGLDPDHPGTGLYYDRPPLPMIRAVAECILGPQTAARANPSTPVP